MYSDYKNPHVKHMLNTEYKKFLEDTTMTGLELEQYGGDPLCLKAKICAPKGSIYEGGEFFADILIPDQYPFSPPKVRIETKIWHPNVCLATGEVCLNILQNEWTPALRIRTFLLTLQSVIGSPELGRARSRR